MDAIGDLRRIERRNRAVVSVIGTIFQGNHLPLHQTLRAFHLIFCTPNITGHRLSRRLGIDYKSAWLLRDRIKNALRNRS